MKTAVKAVVLLLALTTAAMAADKSQLTPSQQEAVSQVKAMAMKERGYLMSECKRAVAQVADLKESAKSLDGDKAKVLAAQVTELEKSVRALQEQLSKPPKYFEDPLNDPLRNAGP